VLACNLPGKDVASVRALLDQPVTTDPEGLEGLAVLTARALDEGTARRDAEEYADELERRGATFDAAAGYDGLGVTVDVPVRRLADVLPLLAEAMLEPAFPENEIERLKAQRLDQITQERANPPSRAHLEFQRTLHDATSRAARPTGGTEETVARLTAEGARSTYTARASAATTTLVVTGDLRGQDVAALVGAAFPAWGDPAAVRSPAVDPVHGRMPAVVLVDRPGSVQTQLSIGHDAPDRSHPDWAAMAVAAYILGGTLTSRIDAVLREEKGYTYGMRAAFSPSRRGGVFGISGSVDTESTAPALDDLMGLLRTAVEQGVTPAERDATVDYLSGVSPLRWETPQAVAAHLAMLVGNELDLGWTDRYLEALRNTTTAAASAALAAHVRPEGLVVVAVGDAESIAEPLGALGLGPVTTILS
jgi:predicted Zn-dependent peptidase